MKLTNLLICPICQEELSQADSSLKCPLSHSYDFAKSGYINLLRPGKKNNAKAGDSKEMIASRSLFFASGCYQPINDKICALVAELAPKVVVDAGCGEGYYTSSIALSCPNAEIFGFDMSKFGAEHGAKISKKNGITNTLYAVSSIFDMPLRPLCVDVIVNMFAPVASEEFGRVLSSNGHFIIASAGKEHLLGLKKALYDEVYLNEVDVPSYEGFELVRQENLKYSTHIIGKDTIQALFQMTPYYHRTSLSDKEKLLAINELETTVEVDFFIFKKI